MSISRYWRLIGISTSGNGPLELSELRIYENGALADAGATLSATFAPTGGSLADLRDGLASGVVSWPYTSYSAAGFALVWDFGVGGGVEFPGLRLGSGNSAATYPLDLTAQSSINGAEWTTYASVIAATYPGALTLSPAAPAVDPNFSKVSLLLQGGLIDQSPRPKVVTAVGNATTSTSQMIMGGPSVYLDGSGDYLSTPSGVVDFDFGYGDFTVECFVKQLSRTAGEYDTLWQLDTGASYRKNMFFLMGDSQFGLLVANPGATAWGANLSISTSLLPSLNVLHHIALTRYGSIWTVWLDGAVVGTVTYAGAVATPTTSFQIGWSGTGDSYFDGYIGGFRVTKGVALYTGAFTPPGSTYDTAIGLLDQLQQKPIRSRQLLSIPEHLLPATMLSASSAHGHLREHPFFDAYNGGIGIITGTVKEKNTPSSTPLYRRVLLVDERSQMAIRETWSDAATGDYEFRGVKQGITYTVVSYDHLHNYRAIIADNQDAT